MKKFLLCTLCSILICILFATVIASCSAGKIQNENNKILAEYNAKISENQKLQNENQQLKDAARQKDEKMKNLQDELSQKNDLNNYVAKEEYNELLSDYLKEKGNVSDLEKKITSLQNEPEKLKAFLDNLNKMLRNVFMGSSDPDPIQYTFTAFSIGYKGEYYIITAGHCVQDNYGADGKFKFKANFNGEWIFPKLLTYKAEFWNLDDYGIFSTDKFSSGLEIGSERTTDVYALGSTEKGLNIFRNLNTSIQK
ncbi:MAG: hypothetical protein M1409_02675, partial [Actinobacteria bacterium]|nr:hypothetical protein [Actinomycetota bacterium]